MKHARIKKICINRLRIMPTIKWFHTLSFMVRLHSLKVQTLIFQMTTLTFGTLFEFLKSKQIEKVYSLCFFS